MSAYTPPDDTDDGGDFSARIAWSENENSRLLSLLLVSHARAARVDADPSLKRAVISREEFSRLVEVIDARGVECAPGTHVSDEPEYYVEIEEDEDVRSCSLGFNERTVEMLTQMAGALERGNETLLRELIAAMQPFIVRRSS